MTEKLLHNWEESRLIRDIEEGVMILDMTGTVVQMNAAACRLLGLDESFVGEKFAELMAKHPSAENDDFYQMVAVLPKLKERLIRKSVPYVRSDGRRLCLSVSSSFLLDDAEEYRIGIFLSFSDETEAEALREKVVSSAKIFIVLLSVMCTWIFIFAIWDFGGRQLDTAVLSKLLIIIALIPAIIVKRGLKLSLREVGLETKGIKKAILTDCLITVGGLVAMVLVKLAIMKISPGFFTPGLPFIRWNKYPFSEYIIYAVSVISQEFISRGMVHECMRRIIPGKNSEGLAILLSAVMFGALHVHVGFVYMIGATALLGVLGIIYRRQNTIWGLCIPHYVLGMVLGMLDFVAY